MDKYQMLDAIIVQLDRLADSRGVERCALLVDLVSRINSLKKGLQEEEDSYIKKIESLKTQIVNLQEKE